MNEKTEDFNPTTSDFNLTVDSERTTIFETSDNDNEKAIPSNLDGCQSSTRPDENEVTSPIFLDVESKVSAKKPMTGQNNSRLYSHHNLPFGNNDPVSDTGAPICIEVEPSTDRHLPKEIKELFPGRDERELIKILKSIQDEMDNIWKIIDKKYLKMPKISWEMWGEFKAKYQSYLSETYKLEAEKMKEAMKILQQRSFGGLILNSKNEVFAVQNHNGTWSAPKGHLKINEDCELETPRETFLRELFEELSVAYETGDGQIKLTKNNIDHYSTPYQNIYFGYHVDRERNSNDRKRLIGLFLIRIDEKKLRFDLADNKENKKWAWLEIDDILSNKPEPGRDIYYTLRPFVQYLKNHPQLLQNL